MNQLNKLVLLCWCQSSTHYLERLCAEGFAPALVVTGSSAPVASALAEVAERYGVPMEYCTDVNSAPFIARLKRLQTDVIFVAGWPRILRDDVRLSALRATINFHPSLLPRYRGRDPLFWALLEGEPTVGVTAHHVTAAVDAGPIVLQREVVVGERDTARTLADRVDRAGAELAVELMKLASEEALLAGHTPADPGSYQRPVRPEDGLIDWTEPAELLDRRIRACQGTIWAHTFLSTMKLVVTEAEPVSLAGSGAPGTVERVDPDALVVRAALPTALLLRRFVFVGREHSAAELASRLNITPGVRLSADAPGPHQNTPP